MAGGAQILREMGGEWLECQDAQGIFYHNAATKQNSDTIPQELVVAANGGIAMGGQPAMGGQEGSTVLRELPNDWLECQDGQGIFYWNKVTQQSSDNMPVELTGVPAMQAPMAVPVQAMAVPTTAPVTLYSTPMAMAAPVQAMAAPMATAAPAQPGQTVILRELPNNWLECKDEQGIYFFNQISQESSDSLPAELMMAGFQAGGVVAPMASVMTTMAAPVMTTMAAPMAAPMAVPMGSYAPIQAQILGGGIQNSYQPVSQPSYQPVTSYAPMQIPQQQSVQQVLAAPGSYLPAQVIQQPSPYVQQAVQPQLQPQMMYQQPQMQPQVVYQQEPQVIYQQEPQVSYQPRQQAPMMQAAPQPQPVMQAQPGPRKKSAWGDWIAFEDAQGEFFVQASTGQRFDTPPPAAVQSYQAHKAAGLVVP